MKLIVRTKDNVVNEYSFDEVVLITCMKTETYDICLKNKPLLVGFSSDNKFILKSFTNPVVAAYVFEQICEYINTDKIIILKTEEEYYQEIKEMEKALGIWK